MINIKVFKFVLLILLMILILFVGYLTVSAPIGMKVFYDKNQDSCSLILHKACCGYKNYLGVTKIEPKFDYCQGFVDGHARVNTEVRIMGWTTDEWKWFEAHPDNPFTDLDGKLLPNSTVRNKDLGTCINVMGDYIQASICVDNKY